MKPLASRTELLFSAKAFAAAMLSVYLSMRIGLPRPFWAMMTAYIVAAPSAGPTRSKGLYRAGGTVLGAVVVTFLVPRLANAPELLSLALALWIGGCLYVSLLDRTPRSYLLMLAGYTAGLIAFPAVNEPGAIFDIALARVEEILLGIACATLVHSLVLPQSFGPLLLARLDAAALDARRWIRDALADTGHAQRSAADRRKLAADITELRLMSTHLPFDTSHLRCTGKAVNALQERLAQFVPVVSSIEDRLQALRDLDAHAVSDRWAALLADVAALTEGPDHAALDAQGAALRARIAALAPAVGEGGAHAPAWTDLIELNLAARLHRLVDLCVETRALRRHIDAGIQGELRGNPQGKLPAAIRDLPGLPASVLHQDRGLALLSAFAAVAAVLACCAFWIVTGWPAGAAAPMMAAVLCCFFSTQDDPVPFIKTFLVYTVYSIPVSAFYLLAVLPAVHHFETLVLACAPVFLVLGVLLARPATFGRAMPFLFGLCGTLALLDTRTADMVSFTNGMLAQVVGLTAAAVFTSVFRRVGAAWTARRILRAGWRDLAALAQLRTGRATAQPDALSTFAARMVDRVGLLTQRLAVSGTHAGTHGDLHAFDALRDLRVGLNMTLLQGLRGDIKTALSPLLAQLGRHFARRPRVEPDVEARLLDALDGALRTVVGQHADPTALAALTGMRRDLFPQAAPWQAAGIR
jgi:uncharacterized membrane protein YccC